MQDILSVGSWTYDIQNNEILCTEEIYKIFETTPEYIDGNFERFLDFVHPQDKILVTKSYEEALKGKENNIELRIITAEGREKYVNKKIKVLLNDNKFPVKIIGTIEDITSRKTVEKSSMELGKELRDAQKIAGIGRFKYDAIKDEIFISEEAYKICNIDPLNLERYLESYFKMIPPADRSILNNAKKYCLEGKNFKVKIRILQEEGTSQYIIVKGEPLLDKDNNIVGIIGIIQDVTENELLKIDLEKKNRDLIRAQHISKIGSWELDLNKGVQYWSDGMFKIYGIKEYNHEVVYEDIFKFVHPEDLFKIDNYLINPPKEKYTVTEYRIIRTDGNIRDIYCLTETTFDNNGKVISICGTIQDVTEMKEMAKKIEEEKRIIEIQKRRFEFLIQNSNDCFGIISPEGTILYSSSAVERILGYTVKEIRNKNMLDFLEGEEKSKFSEMIKIVLKTSKAHIQGELIVKTKYDKKICIEIELDNYIKEPAIEGIVMNWRDITKEKAMYKEIEYIANHDSLTKLPNMYCYLKQIKNIYEEAKKNNISFAIMMLDIDRFKYINNALGYEIGDKLIIEVAKKLKSFIGKKDFLYRSNGDKFIIVVTNLKSIEEYENKVKAIAELFHIPFKVDNYDLNITVSIGVSVFPDDGESLELIKIQVDNALLRAKYKAMNSYEFYSNKMNIQNYKQFMIRNDLPKAIEKCEFRVYYQPEVDIKTNKIIGAEALIRWKHPTWGLVSPGEFVPIAEETGFIINMTNWMLKEICKTYKSWLDKGLPNIKISINYSSLSFLESNFIENIRSVLEEFKLTPEFLIIEITEEILIKNKETVMNNIKKLQALGIEVALDDFGTGYSSLQYLSLFNIDIVKIDRAFIKDALVNKANDILTRHVIEISNELGIKTVAEGIETREQLEYLRKLGCYLGQGYLFSRPVPVDEFEKMLSMKEFKVTNNKYYEVKERRSFNRINFDELLEGQMTILSINGSKMVLGYTKILIKNISKGGLCFISNIRIPINIDIVLRFKITIFEEEIEINGIPIWRDETEENLYEFGVKFILNSDEANLLYEAIEELEKRKSLKVE